MHFLFCIENDTIFPSGYKYVTLTEERDKLKKIVGLIIILVLSVSAGMISLAADNGGKIGENSSGTTIDTNNGTVTTNNGIVKDTFGSEYDGILVWGTNGVADSTATKAYLSELKGSVIDLVLF